MGSEMCIRDRYKYSDLFASMISDLGAIGTASQFGQVGEECNMHQGDTIGRSAVGDLVQTKKETQVNPFPQGQALMNRAHKMAVHSVIPID